MYLDMFHLGSENFAEQLFSWFSTIHVVQVTANPLHSNKITIINSRSTTSGYSYTCKMPHILLCNLACCAVRINISCVMLIPT